MASSGAEHANLGPKQETAIRLEPGTLPAGRARLQQAWHLAQQQAKPIWNLQRKYVSAFQHHSLLPSGSCSLCPLSLCHTPPGKDALLTLPLVQPCLDLGRNALLYQHFCLRPKPSRFPFPSPPDAGFATGRLMSSLLMEPCLLPPLVEEHSGPGVKGSALSSDQQAASPYKAVLSTSPFLRPSSAMVPLLQSLEVKKVRNTHSFPAALRPRCREDADGSPGSLGSGAVKSSKVWSEQIAAPTPTPTPSGTVLGKEQHSQGAAGRTMHSRQERETELRLAGAAEQPAGQAATRPSCGRQVGSSALRNVGSLCQASSRWGQHIIAQLTPKETTAPLDSEPGSHRLNANPSLPGTGGAAGRTEPPGACPPAPCAGSPGHSAHRPLLGALSLHAGHRLAPAEPPHLAALSEVAAQMSTIQLEKEEKQAQAVLPRKLR